MNDRIRTLERENAQQADAIENLQDKVDKLENELKKVNRIAKMAAWMHIHVMCDHKSHDAEYCNHPKQLFTARCSLDTCSALPPDHS